MFFYYYNNDEPYIRFTYSDFEHKQSSSDVDTNFNLTPLQYDLVDEEFYNDHPDYGKNFKTRNNLSRVRRTLFDYAICNHWDFFGTITLNDDNMPRDDLSGAYKKLSKFFNNYAHRKAPRFKYLCVPEIHKDKTNWHFHLLCSGIGHNSLIDFRSYDNIPVGISKLISDGHTVYNFPDVASAFGYCSFIPTYGTQSTIAKYMTKYISKSFDCLKSYTGMQIIRCSKGLKKPIPKFTKTICRPPDDYVVYSCDYGTTYEIPLDKFKAMYPTLLLD